VFLAVPPRHYRMMAHRWRHGQAIAPASWSAIHSFLTPVVMTQIPPSPGSSGAVEPRSAAGRAGVIAVVRGPVRDLCVADNEPYSGRARWSATLHAMDTHGGAAACRTWRSKSARI